MEEKLGKYRIEDRLGQGGMGLVYRAWDTALNRPVALKTIQPHLLSNPEVKARLLNEARAAARLQHPNVVMVYDFGEDEGRLFIAMEYVSGKSLATLSSQELSQDRKLEIMLGISRALHYAHQQGIVHRDVKPSNILIADDGTVKLLDFGIARLADSQLTATGTSMGTPEYMSPEMVEGEKIDARSDIFSCGVLFYELLTNTKPFHHERITTTMYNIIHLDPPPLGKVLPMPQGIEKMVQRMMAKKRDERFESMQPVVEELEERLSEAVLAKADQARQLGEAMAALNTRFEEANLSREVRNTFKADLTRAQQRVRRLSRATDTSVRPDMIESEAQSLKALGDRLEELEQGAEGLPATVPDFDTASDGAEFAEEDSAATLLSAPEPRSSQSDSPPPFPAQAAEAVPEEKKGGTPKPLWIVAAGLILVVGAAAIWFFLPSQGPSPSEIPSSATQSPQPEDEPTPASQPPDSPPATLQEQLQAAYQARSPQQVLDLVQRLEATGSEGGRLPFFKGWALLESNQAAKAVQPLQQAVRNTPQDAQAHYLLGSALASSGQAESAAASYLRALQLGGLAAGPLQTAKRFVSGRDFSFAVQFFENRRSWLGLGNSDKACDGELEVSTTLLRFVSQDCQSRTLSVTILESIEQQEQRVEVVQKNGTKYLFELRASGDAWRFRAVMEQARGFSGAAAGSGRRYQISATR